MTTGYGSQIAHYNEELDKWGQQVKMAQEALDKKYDKLFNEAEKRVKGKKK